jgi:hypothetical protein
MRYMPHQNQTKPNQSVGTILDRNSNSTIERWISSVERNEELTVVAMNSQERSRHLWPLLAELVCRLRLGHDAKAAVSMAAREHGVRRCAQGYTVPMVVEESRILQVSIFTMLHDNLAGVDCDDVMLDVAMIADEVDSQLKQSMIGFAEPLAAKMPN